MGLTRNKLNTLFFQIHLLQNISLQEHLRLCKEFKNLFSNLRLFMTLLEPWSSKNPEILKNIRQHQALPGIPKLVFSYKNMLFPTTIFKD